MSYTNSWWPGATYTAFFGLSAGAGVLGLYALAYSLLGVTAMYLMAERAWVWGKRFDLRTQCDMLGMRFDSKAVRVIASLIGIICLFPGWSWASRPWPCCSISPVSAPGAWAPAWSQRGPDRRATDLDGADGHARPGYHRPGQGIVANGGSALLCLGLLWFSREASYANLATLPSELLRHAGAQGGQYGVWYVSSLILTGVIGSLCWPTSYQRIYTASGVGAVKKGTVQTMIVAGGFCALLTLVALAASGLDVVSAKPQDGWFTLLYHVGGEWMLGLAIVIVLAASMGWVDGCVQVCGAQIANDIVQVVSPRTDRQMTIIAKASMAVFMLGASVVAFLTYDFPRLQLLAQMSGHRAAGGAAVPGHVLARRQPHRRLAVDGLRLHAGGGADLVLDDMPGLGSLTSGDAGAGRQPAAVPGLSCLLRPIGAGTRAGPASVRRGARQGRRSGGLPTARPVGPERTGRVRVTPACGTNAGRRARRSAPAGQAPEPAC